MPDYSGMFAALLLAALDTSPVHPDDVHRFPFLYGECREALRFANSHVDWADRHADNVWRIDARWRRDAWALLRYAKLRGSPESSIRTNLRDLKELIGHEAYWRGIMPFPVPFHRFRDREPNER